MNKNTTRFKDPLTKTSWRRIGDLVQLYWPAGTELQVRFHEGRYESRLMVRAGINEWMPWVPVVGNDTELAGTRAHQAVLGTGPNFEMTPRSPRLSGDSPLAAWSDDAWQRVGLHRMQNTLPGGAYRGSVRRAKTGGFLWSSALDARWRKVPSADETALEAIWKRVMTTAVEPTPRAAVDQWDDGGKQPWTRGDHHGEVTCGYRVYRRADGVQWRYPTGRTWYTAARKWRDVVDQAIAVLYPKTVVEPTAPASKPLSPFVSGQWTDDKGQLWKRGPDDGEVTTTLPQGDRVFALTSAGEIEWRTRTGKVWNTSPEAWYERAQEAMEALYPHMFARKLCRGIRVYDEDEVDEARNEFLGRTLDVYCLRADAVAVFDAALRYVRGGPGPSTNAIPTDAFDDGSGQLWTRTNDPGVVLGLPGDKWYACELRQDRSFRLRYAGGDWEAWEPPTADEWATRVAEHFWPFAQVVKEPAPSSVERTAASFLDAALGHMRDRATTYDRPAGERSMGNCVAAFNQLTSHTLSEEQGWLFMALLKITRTQQGAFRADNYEDLAAYAGLAGEAAARDR